MSLKSKSCRVADWARPALLGALLILSGCQIWPDADDLRAETAGQSGSAQTIEDFDTVRARDPQAGIGARGHPKILAAYGGAYEDEKLESLLAIIAGALVAKTDDPNRAYDITILDSATVNAFALPGGYLYVTRGLLALANDGAEVAAVLAHEMAHVSANHGLQRSREAQAADIAEDVLANVVSNELAVQVAKASAQQKLAAFSQRQELQADAIGIRHMAAAGYDAFAASRFLNSMKRYSAWRSSLSAPEDDMASTHPSTPQRIELAKRHARQSGPEGTGKRKRKRFLEGIDGMIFGEKASEGFVRGNVFAHTGLGITFSVPVDFDLTNRSDAVLASGPNQQALRFDAVAIKDRKQSAASYLASGWVNGLDAESVRPVTINGNKGAAGYAAAGDWQFSITVINAGRMHYRFILAAPRDAAAVINTGHAIAKTFRTLTKTEIARLKPLRLKVVTVRSGDTVARLAGRMQGVKRKVALFRALNGLDSKGKISPGSQVKLVRAD